MIYGDTVSRQAANAAICNACGIIDCDQMDKCKKLLTAQPERETAKFIRWMEIKKADKYISYTPHCKCSKCGTEFLIETIKYCYMCGARMEGK